MSSAILFFFFFYFNFFVFVFVSLCVLCALRSKDKSSYTYVISTKRGEYIFFFSNTRYIRNKNSCYYLLRSVNEGRIIKSVILLCVNLNTLISVVFFLFVCSFVGSFVNLIAYRIETNRSGRSQYTRAEPLNVCSGRSIYFSFKLYFVFYWIFCERFTNLSEWSDHHHYHFNIWYIFNCTVSCATNHYFRAATIKSNIYVSRFYLCVNSVRVRVCVYHLINKKIIIVELYVQFLCVQTKNKKEDFFHRDTFSEFQFMNWHANVSIVNKN